MKHVIYIGLLWVLLANVASAFARDFEIDNSSGALFFASGSSTNVGVSTITPQGGFVVTNGNVGIGTWAPFQLFEIGARSFDVTASGNVGIGTKTPTGALEIEGGNVGINTAATTSNALTVFGGNVGIGTTTAPNSLYVNGTLEMTGFKMNNAAASGYVLVSNAVGIGTWMPSANLSVPGSAAGTVPQLQYNNNGSLGGVANSGVDANGNVGIGTSGPKEALAVSGNVGIGTQSYSKYITTTPTASGLTVEGNVGIGTWMIDNAGLSVMSGNVGIATWVPTALFQVGKFNSSAGGFEVDANGNVGLGTILTSSAALSVMDGNVGIGTWVPAAAFEVGKFSSSSSGFIVDINGNVGLGTTKTSLSALSVMNGNVGIGTWVANAALIVNGNMGISTAFANNAVEVGGTAEMTGFKMNNGGGNGYVLVSSSVGAGTWMPATTLNTVVAGSPGGTTPQLQYNSSGSMGGVANSGADANGNVGIGTLGPRDKLAVVGNVGIGTQSYSKYITTTPTASGLVVEGSIGIGTWYLDNAGLVVMSGNVGIGTWVPASLFQVGKFSSSSSGFEVDANGNVGLGTVLTSLASLSVLDGNVGIGTWVPAGLLQVGTLTGGGFVLDANGNWGLGTTKTSLAALSIMDGNVGIGTWIATAPLVVNGNMGISTVFAPDTLEIAGTAEVTGFKLPTGASGGFVLVTNGAGVGTWMPAASLNVSGSGGPGGTVPQLQYNNYGASAGVPVSGADTNGNIGIGTLGPKEKLAVVGSVGIGSQSYSNYLTVAAPSGGMVVEGNSGIGTYLPSQLFEIGKQKLDITSGGNIGVGTINPTNFEIEKNVGINTALSTNNALTVFGGNVGLGTTIAPNALYVNGTVEMQNFKMNNAAVSGYLMVGNSVGVGTWMPSTTLNVTVTATPGGSTPQLQYDNNGAMGGVASSGIDGNGNIGIGTSGPRETIAVVGNVGIGTQSYSKFITTTPTATGLAIEGNLGIGTWDIDNAGLSVVGGNVGIATWVPAAAFQVGAFSSSNSGFVVDLNGNVGIGTILTSQAALSVITGDVGIGTWIPANSLDIVGGDLGLDTRHALVGIGTTSSILKINDVTSVYAGWRAGANMTTIPTYNTAVGREALYSNLDSDVYNVAIGYQALYSNTNTYNTAVGYQALYSNTSGSDNTAIGYQALYSNTSGIGNTAVGYQALSNISTGGGNTGVGYQAGRLTSGGSANQTSLDSIYIGYQAYPKANGDINEIVIGYQATGIGNNSAILGNSSIATTELFGNVGINTQNPNYKLQISGCTSKNGTLSCVDMAELIPSSQPVDAADIVMLDPSKPVTVMKAVIGSPSFLKRGSGGVKNADLLLGVVTTDPAIVIEGKILGVFGAKGYILDPHKPAVALAGRVPVKVSLENGPIQEGDMITASSVPGIGAKAVKPGRVIGMALEPMNDLKGKSYQKIFVYVNPHWWGGSIEKEANRLMAENEALKRDAGNLDGQDEELRAQLKALEARIHADK